MEQMKKRVEGKRKEEDSGRKAREVVKRGRQKQGSNKGKVGKSRERMGVKGPLEGPWKGEDCWEQPRQDPTPVDQRQILGRNIARCDFLAPGAGYCNAWQERILKPSQHIWTALPHPSLLPLAKESPAINPT